MQTVHICVQAPRGTPIWKRLGCPSEILNQTPTGDQPERGPTFILPLKETIFWQCSLGIDVIKNLKQADKIYLFILSSRATLEETFTAEHNNVLSRTP